MLTIWKHWPFENAILQDYNNQKLHIKMIKINSEKKQIYLKVLSI